jgi:hypothetical protein
MDDIGARLLSRAEWRRKSEMLKRGFVLAVSALLASLWAQTSAEPNGKQDNSQTSAASQKKEPSQPAARAADVSSIDAIVKAAYATISGPKGEKRDWNRFRSLFLPGGRLIYTDTRKEGGYVATSVSASEYAAQVDPFFDKESFFEVDTSRHIDRYGNIVQLFSLYESRHDPKDPKPYVRGINSFQLFFDGTRWWIVSILWQEETPDVPIPKELFSGKTR